MQFKIDAEYYGRIYVYGSDPLGAPVAMSVPPAVRRRCRRASRPRSTTAQEVQGSFPLEFGSGSVVTVTQPGWFSHTVTLGSVGGAPDRVRRGRAGGRR